MQYSLPQKNLAWWVQPAGGTWSPQVCVPTPLLFNLKALLARAQMICQPGHSAQALLSPGWV